MKDKHAVPSIHCRSYYSFLTGAFSPEEICRRAADEGASAVGMVDRGGLYGLPAFYRAAGRYGLKALGGVSFDSPGPVDRGIPLFTFYPLNRAGFSRLNRLVTRNLTKKDSDPVELLLEEGWEGGRVAVFRPELLSRLAERGVAGLRAALVWGLPFRSMLSAARKLRIPPLALNLAVYADKEGARLYRLLRAVDKDGGKDPGDFQRRRSPEEMEAYFSAVPEALRETRLLAADAEAPLFPGTFVFPSFKGLAPTEEFERLRALCRRGIRARYGQGGEAVDRRLSYELDIIGKKGFAGYFLVVRDIVSRCPRTCGRGSSAASIVSYLLGITHVDPLAQDLFFERFLNMGRTDPPDIDVDFPWDEREKTLDYVFETYAGRAGMVADHVTFGRLSALREAARAYGMPEPDIGPMVQAFRAGEAELPPYIAAAARRLFGIPRHLGSHPGGVVITPGPISDYTHLQTSPLGRPLIAWEKDGTEDAGLVKIDLLGNRSLGVLRDVLALSAPLREKAGDPPLEWSSFNPLNDSMARAMIEKGDTLGVFYVESPATRQLLKKMRRGDYNHLIIASSIIRPAANRYINEFIERLRGKSYKTLHPAAAKVLKDSYGIMVYQEDVSRVAAAVCGFDAAEADGLRKVLSKKDRHRRLPEFRERFFTKGSLKGVSQKVLSELWEGILSFEGYSFCKAHSASYAFVSYRLAWLKARYPLEFFCAVINNGGGFYARQVYINAIARRGFPVLPPQVNRSEAEYTVERREHPRGALRAGFLQIKSMDENFVRRILEDRRNRGPYRDFQDFCTRLNPSLPDIRGLIRSGTLDPLAGDTHRPGLFWRFFHASRYPELFALPPVPPSVSDYPDQVKLRDEEETLDLVLSRRPAELLLLPEREDFTDLLADSRDIANLRVKRGAIPAVVVAGKETVTRTRQSMCFMSFEDRYGIFEAVLFPGIYRRLYPLICKNSGFLVIGTVDAEFEVPLLVVEELIALDSVNQVCHYRGGSGRKDENRYTRCTLEVPGG